MTCQAQMEAILDEPIEEGQVPKTPVEVITQVLPSTKFLKNADVQPPAATRAKTVAAAERVEYLEAKLAVEEQESASLKEKIAGLEEAKEKQQDMPELK